MTSKNTGYIKLYIGPMFSGKSSSLIEDYTRHSIGQRKCLNVKHSIDNRYSEQEIVSHDGRHITSVSCGMLCEIDKLVSDYKVICIDEIQFFEDAPIFCDKWANQGLIVECAGLCGDYKREPFDVMTKLIPLAEEVCMKSAVCRETGEDAAFTFRTSKDVDTIVIGGTDKYKPVDRQTYFSEMSHESYTEYRLIAFKKFTKLFLNKTKTKLSDNQENDLWEYFKSSKETDCYVDILNKYIDKLKM